MAAAAVKREREDGSAGDGSSGSSASSSFLEQHLVSFREVEHTAMQTSSHPDFSDQPPQPSVETRAATSSSSSTVPAWQPRHVSAYKRTEKLTLIGEGTYGSVFLAKDPSGELVALKKIRKEKKEGVSDAQRPTQSGQSSPPPRLLTCMPSPPLLCSAPVPHHCHP